MAGRRVVLACLIATLIFNSALLANSNGWVIKQLTNSGYIAPTSYDADFAVSGKNVVWVELNKRIMFSDGDVTKQITDGTKYVCWPQISGNNVAWMQQTDDVYQIMLWDGAAIRQISNGNNEHYLYGISGNNVVWIESPPDDYYNYQVMFWDGNNARQISNGEGSCNRVQISGANVAWVQEANDVQEIMLWNGDIARQIASGQGFSELQISGTNLVWCEYTDSSRVIFWDGQTARQISDVNTYNESPRISGRNVVWLAADYDFDYMAQQVMFWNGETAKRLTANLKWKNYLSVSGNNVVWLEHPREYLYTTVFLIYYWDGKAATKLMEGEGWCTPLLSGSNLVFKTYDENYDYQIYSAYRHGRADFNRNK